MDVLLCPLVQLSGAHYFLIIWLLEVRSCSKVLHRSTNSITALFPCDVCDLEVPFCLDSEDFFMTTKFTKFFQLLYCEPSEKYVIFLMSVNGRADFKNVIIALWKRCTATVSCCKQSEIMTKLMMCYSSSECG